jgi:1,4-dihydroxy-2-naphthoate octaprenyltransferase
VLDLGSHLGALGVEVKQFARSRRVRLLGRRETANGLASRGDEAAGKRTLVVRLGAEQARWGYLIIALLAYGWLVLMVGREVLPQKAAGAALTLVLSFHAARELLAHADTPAELGKAIRLTIIAANLHGLLLAAALAFARWPA